MSTLPPIDSYLTTETQPVGERCPQCGDVGRVLIDGQCFDCHDRKPPCSHCGGEGFVDVQYDVDDIREQACDRCQDLDDHDDVGRNGDDVSSFDDRRDDGDRYYDGV